MITPGQTPPGWEILHRVVWGVFFGSVCGVILADLPWRWYGVPDGLKTSVDVLNGRDFAIHAAVGSPAL